MLLLMSRTLMFQLSLDQLSSLLLPIFLRLLTFPGVPAVDSVSALAAVCTYCCWQLDISAAAVAGLPAVIGFLLMLASCSCWCPACCWCPVPAISGVPAVANVPAVAGDPTCRLWSGCIKKLTFLTTRLSDYEYRIIDYRTVYLTKKFNYLTCVILLILLLLLFASVHLLLLLFSHCVLFLSDFYYSPQFFLTPLCLILYSSPHPDTPLSLLFFLTASFSLTVPVLFRTVINFRPQCTHATSLLLWLIHLILPYQSPYL